MRRPAKPAFWSVLRLPRMRQAGSLSSATRSESDLESHNLFHVQQRDLIGSAINDIAI
jgi:hypothetical protein